MKKTWQFLNGNKTIICLGAATILQEAVKYGVIGDSKSIQFSISICLILGGGALGHHIKKGYFSTKKN